MVPGTDIEAMLIGELRGMRDDFREMSQKFGEMSAEIKHLAMGQESIASHEKRLTVLETQSATTEKWVENARANSRWLIGLTIASILSAGAIVVAVVMHH